MLGPQDDKPDAAGLFGEPTRNVRSPDLMDEPELDAGGDPA